MLKKLTALLLCALLLLSSCGDNAGKHKGYTNPETKGDVPDLGDDSKTYGDALNDLGAYDGDFEGESKDFTLNCEAGTQNAYKLEGTTLKFTRISSETVYSISGKFKGNIIIDVGDDYKFELVLNGFSLICDTTSPIVAISGDEVSVKAKKSTKNYIYDKRSAVGEETEYDSAIYAEVDLEIGGKGELTVISENNNGIHTKDDLQVKNLSLLVFCVDNALKGNDGVEITECITTLIATAGDGIKTSNNNVSSKGNQRGTISINGGIHSIYAACDGIDSAYNVVIDNSNTKLNIYTDKYSNYSSEVTATSSTEYYIRFTSDQYKYSVKYYNSDTDFVWVNAKHHSSVPGSRGTYFYHSFEKKTEYDKMQFFIYSSDMKQGQDEEYVAASEYLEPNTAYDTFALSSRGNQISFSWTNYTTNIVEGGPGGMGGHGRPGGGGMNDGNSDKGEYSAKGIKASNEIVIKNGIVNIKSYDDAIHAKNDALLENGKSPLGNVTIDGGTVTVYTNDDGLHADGTLTISSGTVTVSNSYEGIEGEYVKISGGYLSINAKDDGVNSTAQSGTSVAISGGIVYIYCTGDGIDSNSRTSYKGIVFSGGNTVVISNSGGNSAIDSEQGYSHNGGSVIAVMPQRGMANEATNCLNFSDHGCYKQLSLSEGQYLTAEIGSSNATVKIPASISAFVIILGDNSANISTKDTVTVTLDENGVAWN